MHNGDDGEVGNRSRRILDILAPLILRFPEFPTANALYNRNFVSIVDQSIEKSLLHPDITHTLDVGESLSVTAHYVENSDSAYDERKLSDLYCFYDDCFAKLKPFLSHLDNIQNDLLVLKNKSPNFSALAKKLIRCSPLIYDQLGQAINPQLFNSNYARTVSPVELQALYTDHFNVHLQPLIHRCKTISGMGEIEKISNNTQNQFIPKTVIPATRLHSVSRKNLKSRFLRLEDVPPIYTPLRGAVAKDCSMVTVPFYGLLKSTRLFWVFNDVETEQSPIGYVFLIEIRVKGKTVPYIVTINGPMVSTTQCHAIFKLIANLYETETAFVANWKSTQYLVNYAPIRESLSLSKTSKIDIDLPSGWMLMNDERSSMNCYSDSAVSSGVAINIDDIPGKLVSFTVSDSKREYPPLSHYKNLPIIARTILVYFFKDADICSQVDDEPGDYLSLEKIQQKLSVSDDQLNNIQLFFNLYRHHQFSVDSFLTLNRSLNYSLSDLNTLDPVIRASILSPLYREHSELFPEQDWKATSQATFRQLQGRLQDTTLAPGSREVIRDHMASIPDTLVENYWQSISRFLFVENTETPDYYALQRLIRNLNSVDVVNYMLEFLDENSKFTDLIQAYNKRWFEFFTRAAGDGINTEIYRSVVNKAYYKKSLDKNANLAIYEMAKLYVYGCELNFTDASTWFEEICVAQSFRDRSKQEFSERIAYEQKQLL